MMLAVRRLRFDLSQAYAARLGRFSVHLEHETAGAVTLKRLPASHPQHQRCLKAATENVKRGYFEDGPGALAAAAAAGSTLSKCRFSGVNVLEVYKIENRPLLGLFQAAASAAEAQGGAPPKVKGLFCRVPRRCLERVVAHGAHAAPPPEIQAAFTESW